MTRGGLIPIGNVKLLALLHPTFVIHNWQSTDFSLL